MGAGGQRHRYGYRRRGIPTHEHTRAHMAHAYVDVFSREQLASVCEVESFSVFPLKHCSFPILQTGGRPVQESPLLAQTGLQTQLSHPWQVQGDHQIPH